MGTADGRVTGVWGGVADEVNGELRSALDAELSELERALSPALPENPPLIEALSPGNRRAGVMSGGVFADGFTENGEGVNAGAKGFVAGVNTGVRVVWKGKPPPAAARGNVGSAESVAGRRVLSVEGGRSGRASRQLRAPAAVGHPWAPSRWRETSSAASAVCSLKGSSPNLA